MKILSNVWMGQCGFEEDGERAMCKEIVRGGGRQAAGEIHVLRSNQPLALRLPCLLPLVSLNTEDAM